VVHYCPDGQDKWLDAPLTHHEIGWALADLEGVSQVEFVVRDAGGTEWDHPGGASKNYKVDISTCAAWTLRQGRLARVQESPILVVSDIDHTMVGHEKDPGDQFLSEFCGLWFERYAFGGSSVVYSTGRNKKEALSIALEKGLPRPAMLICAVGTEIYDVPTDLPLNPPGAWATEASRIVLDEEWEQVMRETFNRTTVEELLGSRFPKLQLRGNAFHDPFRIPSTIEIDSEFQATLREMRTALSSSAQVIVSGSDEWKFVDFCSPEAGKLAGVQFCMKRLGVAPERTLACGDSGNDESMYRCPGVRCVAVGNALSELVTALGAIACDGPAVVTQGGEFATTAGSIVLYAERQVAGAIVEALSHFWPTSGGEP